MSATENFGNLFKLINGVLSTGAAEESHLFFNTATSPTLVKSLPLTARLNSSKSSPASTRTECFGGLTFCLSGRAPPCKLLLRFIGRDCRGTRARSIRSLCALSSSAVAVFSNSSQYNRENGSTGKACVSDGVHKLSSTERWTSLHTLYDF